MPRTSRGPWVALVLAVLLIAGGAVVATRGYRADSGPAGAVLGYYAALARGDAPTALAYGAAKPTGNTGLLTKDVLDQQNRASTPQDVRVLHADDTTVLVQYRLFGAQVGDAVPVVRQDGRWALRSSAVAVTFAAATQQHRLLVGGAGVPAGPVLVFPGAAPARFDNPVLALSAGSRQVRFAGPPTIALTGELTDPGRQAVTAGVVAALDQCLAEPSPPCPLPAGGPRVVPGTLRGKPGADLAGALKLTVPPGADGRIDFSATLPVDGTYQQFDGENLPAPATGRVELTVAGHCFATDPRTIAWDYS
jgi:hypothetical protein